jgi:aminocarboxymuconate-semialdehyde decarboxylase
MPVVDIHSHVIPPSVVEAIATDPIGFSARIEEEDGMRKVVHDQGYAYPLFEEFVEPEAKLREMDRRGLDVSVLSPPPPLFYYWAEAEMGVQVARLVNDGIAEYVATSPERFIGMATVPMQDTEAAVAELERVVSTYRFQAVEIGTSVEGTQLTDPRFRQFLRRASELDVLILAHPYYVGAKQGLEDYYLTNLLGNPYDSTVKHGHRGRPEPRVNTDTPPLKLLGRLFFDTITFCPLALRYLIDLVGAEHVVLGTDAPFDMGDEDPLKTVGAIPGVTDEEREAILSKTASELLGNRTRGAV